jgi:hypothetical protein
MPAFRFVHRSTPLAQVGGMVTVRFTLLLATMSVALAGCGGNTPSAPTSVGGGPSPVYRGSTVSAIDGRPMGGITIKVGSQTGTSDESGNFTVTSVTEGSMPVVLSGAAIYERQRMVTLPSDSARETLIPTTFDLEAFDEMFRGTGKLQRWLAAPGLVVLAKVMQYSTTFSDEEYHATPEELTDAEINTMIAHLTGGLSLLTGGTFTAFSSVEIENPASNARVDTLRPGQIVVGRYRDVQSLGNTIGTGRWAAAGSGEILGGSIYLDRNFDRSSSARELLRIHELGHALGYLHVTKRTSIMNPAIGPEPTDFDRQAAIIAFRRMPGNQSPDTDPAGAPPTGTIFGLHSGGHTRWSAPVICGQ